MLYYFTYYSNACRNQEYLYTNVSEGPFQIPLSNMLLKETQSEFNYNYRYLFIALGVPNLNELSSSSFVVVSQIDVNFERSQSKLLREVFEIRANPLAKTLTQPMSQVSPSCVTSSQDCDVSTTSRMSSVRLTWCKVCQSYLGRLYQKARPFNHYHWSVFQANSPINWIGEI